MRPILITHQWERSSQSPVQREAPCSKILKALEVDGLIMRVARHHERGPAIQSLPPQPSRRAAPQSIPGPWRLSGAEAMKLSPAVESRWLLDGPHKPSELILHEGRTESATPPQSLRGASPSYPRPKSLAPAQAVRPLIHLTDNVTGTDGRRACGRLSVPGEGDHR
jgi:hypothetical protein